MKKNFFKKIIMGSVLAVGCLGLLTACGEDKDPKKPTTTYTLVFDADNNEATTNVSKIVNKADLNDKSEWPIIEEQDGYAGEWSLKGWKGNTATLIAKYGTGSEQNPYLISNETQFRKMAESVSKQLQAEQTTYLKGGEVSTSSDYDEVVTQSKYATVEVNSSTKNSVKTWTYQTNKQYFRLIDDINFSTATIAASGYSSFALDGTKYNVFTQEAEGKYKLKNVSKTTFTSGKMFNIIVDTTVSNVDISLINDLVQIASYTSGGVYNKGLENERRDTANFLNIKIDSNGAPISQLGDNSSAFISHVMHDSSFNIKNCVMDVTKINSSASYAGIFVGGYPKTDGKVTFENCVNNTDITSTGAIGFFFGNDSYKANNINQNIHEMINCVNTGTLIGSEKSHILATFQNNGSSVIRFNEAEVKSLDGGVDGKFVHSNGGSLTALKFKDATIVNNNLVLPAASLSLENGKTYTIVVNVENALHHLDWEDGDKKVYSSFTTNIPITFSLTINGEYEDFAMEDIYCSVTDVEQYCEKYSVDAATIQWNNNANCEYYWDKTNHIYVINTTDYFGVMKTGDSVGNYVRYTIAVKDGDTINSIFIATPKENVL